MRRSAKARAALLLALTPLLTGALGQRENFDSRVLTAQNRERSALGLEPLQWDPELASSARAWADQLARTGRFAHSPDDPASEPEGENLWEGTPGAYSPEAMVGLWAAEKRNFRSGVFPDNSRTGNVEDVGHYTQLIWASTREVGCALAHAQSDDILVCRYKSAGNVIGQNPLKPSART